MNILEEKELILLKRIFQLNQPTLKKILSQFLKRRYKRVIETDEYIIAIGNIPVALVAHLDTVFKYVPDKIFHDPVYDVLWSPDGLGADDRAGVYSIIKIVQAGYLPTIIFTTDEEIGGIGASALISKYYTPIKRLKYIIELDRQGEDDCVFYNCGNKKFTEYIESFGFYSAFGTFSDISIICPVWGIAGVNLSIGYVDEHSYAECLYIEHMTNTIQKVKEMLDDIKNAEYYDYIDIYTANKNSSLIYGYEGYPMTEKEWKYLKYTENKNLCECSKCNTKEFDYNCFPVQDDNKIKIYCADCVAAAEEIEWCSICGEPFIPNAQYDWSNPICYNCGIEEENK